MLRRIKADPLGALGIAAASDRRAECALYITAAASREMRSGWELRKSPAHTHTHPPTHTHAYARCSLQQAVNTQPHAMRSCSSNAAADKTHAEINRSSVATATIKKELYPQLAYI